MTSEVSRALLGSKLRLRASGPYFSVLIGHLRIVQDDNICPPTACVNGKVMKIHGPFWMSLTPEVRDFVLVHEVLHCALGHCWRGHGKWPLKWNVACDFVVNLILRKACYKIWPNCLINDKYDHMSVEEVYALLDDDVTTIGTLTGSDVLEGGEEAKSAGAMWRQAEARARVAEKMYGSTAMGSIIQFHEEASRVSWRDELWKMVNARKDFAGYDRRLIYSETYVEDLQNIDGLAGLSALCIDTSGSTMGVMGKFVGEVKEICDIMGAEFPLYFDDAELVGPVPMEEIDRPVGGGGTSFVPFFDEVKEKGYERVVYLTDLCGSFPDRTDADVLWVVPPGVTDTPPFGRVVKILD